MSASTKALALLTGMSLAVVLAWSLWHPYPRVPLGQRSSTKPIGFKIDLNTANAATLQLLPGVGPNIAQNIVHARLVEAVFHSPADLEAVKFIGPSVVNRVEPWVVYNENQPGPNGTASVRE